MATISRGSIPRETPVLSFATNWSTPEFKLFVDDLADLVDDIYKNLGDDAWMRAVHVWERVVELEESFWPRAGEEIA
jgi:thiaminase